MSPNSPEKRLIAVFTALFACAQFAEASLAQTTSSSSSSRSASSSAASSKAASKASSKAEGGDGEYELVELDDDEDATLTKEDAEKKAAEEKKNARRISKEVAPLLRLAYQEMVEHNFRKAVSYLRTALKADPHGITAQRYMAYCLAEAGLPQHALASLTQLIRQIKPTYFEWCTFGEVYLQSLSYEHAEKCYQEALKLNPNSDYARSGLIRVYIGNDRWDEAMKLALEGLKSAKTMDLYNYYKSLYARAMERRSVAPPEDQQPGGNNDMYETKPEEYDNTKA